MKLNNENIVNDLKVQIKKKNFSIKNQAFIQYYWLI